MKFEFSGAAPEIRVTDTASELAIVATTSTRAAGMSVHRRLWELKNGIHYLREM